MPKNTSKDTSEGVTSYITHAITSIVTVPGVRFMALRPGSKVPLEGSRGVLDATDNPKRVKTIVNAKKNNVALATGHGDIVVLDVDVRGHKEGLATLDALEERHGKLPETLTVRTASGGQHLYFLHPNAQLIRSSNNRLGDGIDIKASGGYVVCPPSKVQGKPYTFVNPDVPIADLPEEWYDLMAITQVKELGRGQVAVGEDDEWTIGDAVEMLSHIDADIDYDMWLRVGLALWNKFGDDAFEIYDEWSSCGSKYPGAAETKKKWASFARSSTDDPVTMGTIVYLAMEEGWSPQVDLGAVLRMIESKRPWKQVVSRLLRVNPPKKAFNDTLAQIRKVYDLKAPEVNDFIKDNTAEVDSKKIEWVSVQKNGRPTPTMANACVAVGVGLRDIYRLEYDQFTRQTYVNGKALTDRHVTQFQSDVERMLGVAFGKDAMNDAIQFVAHENQTDSLADYLDSIPAADTGAFADFMNVLAITPGSFQESAFRRTLVAAVARAYVPAFKHDTALVLVGRQGTFKSSLFRELCPTESWFSDNLRALSSKDDLMQLRGKWFAEMAELSAINRQTAEEVKHFLSLREDEYRAPYGRHIERYPRRCIFVGTTNDMQFLTDYTGNRRFWVCELEPGERAIEWVRTNRNALWSDVKRMYRDGERTWFNSKEQVKVNEITKEFEINHPWLEILRDELSEASSFQTSYVLEIVLDIDKSRARQSDVITVGKLLRKLDFRYQAVRFKNGQVRKVWKNPDNLIHEKYTDGVYIGGDI